jgi:CheY-like chemotaxis protein
MEFMYTQKKGKRSVLLVEDNLMNQFVVTRVLNQMGIEVTTANNGKEAVDLVSSKRFQLILMDIQMPEMDGWEATRQIRRMPDSYFQNIPILAFTASSLIDSKEKARQYGMDDFLLKPFDLKDIQTKINHYINRLSEEQGLRPLHVNFELYADAEPEFKMELIDLMIRNVMELQDAIKKTQTTRDVSYFDSIVHKIKATIMLLDDPEFTQLILDLRPILERPTELNGGKKIEEFHRISHGIVLSLQRQNQFLKAS